MGDIFVVMFANYIAPILGTMLMVLLMFALKKLADKLGVKLEKDHLSLIENTAEVYIRATEEKAAAQLKTLGDKVDANCPKIDKFADVVGALVKRFPKLTEEEAGNIVNAIVSKIPNIGASQT